MLHAMTHRRGALAVAVVCLFFASVAGAAGADVLRSTVGQPLREVSHSVDITVAKGIATYRVRRVFANPGDVADEAGLAIDLPFGAAATGLRIRARSRWYDGELMEREKAAKLYQELTGKGAFAPKDPALLQWLWADKLYLQVFPVLPGQASTVEYTLTVPTRYSGGKVFLSYPRLASPDRNEGADGEGGGAAEPESRPMVAPVITVTPAWGDAMTRVIVDGMRVTPGAPIVLPQAVRPAWAEAVEMSEHASYVSSTVTVPATAASKKAYAEAKVKLAIEHTYRSDLRVDLVTPRGARVEVFGGSGGGDNDLKGTFTVKLPAGTTGAGMWRLVVSDHAGLDVGTVDAWALELGAGAAAVKAEAADLPLFIPDAPENASDAGLATIELAPPKVDVLVARLGKVVASDKHSFGRLELDLAPELRPLPVKPKVVFVVDASHSIGAAGIDAQLAMAQAYLSHVPDAMAEIVVYRRTASRLFGALVPAADLGKRLAEARKAGKLAPGNGSALDEGGKLAAEILRGEKAGPGKDGLRVVLTTDELVRSSLDKKQALAALAALPRDVILHVVVPALDESETMSLTRDDATELAPLAAAHRGMMARVDGLPAKTQKDLARTMLGLVRPMQLDYVKIAGLEVDAGLDGEGSDVLREGAGLREMRGLAKAPDSVTVSGKIWGDTFKRVVAVDAGFSRATAGWVFSEDEYGELSEAEQMKVAMMGRAVSPVTSYIAVEPGVRPSTAGIDRIGHGSGTGSGYGVGSGRGGMRGRVKPDLLALVQAGARACIAKHKPAAGWQVRLDAESTRDEIVDVKPMIGDKLAITPCLVEAVWAVRLTAAFDAEREMHALVFK
jgi:subtilisin-like proprotein convertase family protein